MCKFTLFCRKFAIILINAFLCKMLALENSGRVKVLTNIMSASSSPKQKPNQNWEWVQCGCTKLNLLLHSVLAPNSHSFATNLQILVCTFSTPRVSASIRRGYIRRGPCLSIWFELVVTVWVKVSRGGYGLVTIVFHFAMCAVCFS